MNNFGGDWTKIKIEILVDYANAYLTIMNNYSQWKLLYFDGFAGSGFIIKDKSTGTDITIGAARRIIEIDSPKSFDEYYFVEKDPKNFKLLKENTKQAYPTKKIHCTNDDCNTKLQSMAAYLKEHQEYRTLAYIDPCGMQLEWNSIECLRGLGIDAWILVPTGLGVNRLLVNNGQISDSWMERLQKFLGMDSDAIRKHFYSQKVVHTLFGEESFIDKEDKAIEKSGLLYQKRLEDVFECVSKPYILRNTSNSIMYHLYFASNNKAGKKIANDIVDKYQKISA